MHTCNHNPVNQQQLTISNKKKQLSIVNCQLSIINHQSSIINQQSTINNQQSTIINYTSNNMMLVPDERVALLAWVKSASHSNVVIDDSVNALVSIKNLSILQISVTALRLFCVHQQISGYKNKSKEVTCMLNIQWTRMKAI